ncbi:restriction endonuclease subunit S [Macrococcoides canis]|uniref:restriction endonuclease subunit S n=1 Tax=Macrococcoides canis TaxID=1855823 RepID=UPI0020B71713|nr:restriction endonuclease subunit S [Macrococcus canis]UTH00528.1 restriction endonuclease subunit S [Macrococcus canis]
MSTYKLEQLVQVIQGSPISRLSQAKEQNKTYNIYNQSAFLYDLNGIENHHEVFKEVTTSERSEDELTQVGDIVMSMSTSEVVSISERYAGFILPFNYSKLKVNDFNIIDPSYLEFWINESSSFLNQSGGTPEKRGRMTISKLKECQITLPSIDIQKNAGDLYKANQRILIKQLQKVLLVNKLLAQKTFVEEEND